MRITSLGNINNLSTHRAKIINIPEFNSEKLSIIETNNIKYMSIMITNHFFLAVDNLKGYFEEHDDKNDIVGKAKNNKYLTIIFTSKYQKLMYTDILKKLIKILIKIMLKLNLNLMIMYL